jgi:putative peptidoglycan lipid II flippase
MPALAPVLLNLSLIAGALIGWALLDPPILALGAAVVWAGILQVLVQLPPLRARGLMPRAHLAPRHPAVRRVVWLMGPAVVGASIFQLNMVVSRFLSSFLGDGAVSYLYYADRLLEFPLGVFVFALGTASLPAFSRLARAGDLGALRTAFSGTLGLALALSLPSTVGLVLLRNEVFDVLFAWNPTIFGEEAARGCARALQLYALGLVPITVSRICVGLCFAHQDARSPARAAGVAFGVHLFAALALIGPLPETGLPGSLVRFQHSLVLADLGYAGLAAAASVAALANALYLLAVVLRRYAPLAGREESRRISRLVVGCLALGLAVEGSRRVLPEPTGATLQGAAVLVAQVGIGVVAYAGVLGLLRSPELRALLGIFSRRESA